MPTGFIATCIGEQLGNYIGTFMEYDENNNLGLWRTYILIQVLLDVNTPLKRKEDRIGKWGMGYDPLQVQEIGNLLLPLWDGGTLGWLLTNIVLILWSHGYRELGNGGDLG